MTFESQPTRIFVLDYLTNSLVSTRNVYVKTKVAGGECVRHKREGLHVPERLTVASAFDFCPQVLKLLLVLLQEGHADFHHSLRKSSDCLRDTAGILFDCLTKEHIHGGA